MIEGFVVHNGSKFYYQAERTAKGNLQVIDIRLHAPRSSQTLRLKSNLAQTVIALIEKQEKEQQNERITK